MLTGLVAGAAGGIAGSFGGFHARRNLVRALGSPDWPIAVVEDIVAIAGGLFVVAHLR
jgi:uncharacterized membrane protein